MRRRFCSWALVCWAAAGGVAQAAEAPPKLVAVCIKRSLEASLNAAVPRYGRALAAEVARLLRWRGNINRLVQPQDQLSLLFGPGATEPELYAFRYLGAELVMDAYRFVGDDGVARYFDRDARLIEPVMLNAPVVGYSQITEVVQHGRGRRRHQGDDLKAPIGSRVVLPFSGTVARVNWAQRRNGHCIEVFLDAGFVAHFLHLNDVEPGVRPGAILPAQTLLGHVGNTGRSNAAHLHYELLRGKTPVEPLVVHGRRAGALDVRARPLFFQQRDGWDRQLRGPP